MTDRASTITGRACAVADDIVGLDADTLVSEGVKNLYESAAFLGISRPKLYALMDDGDLVYLYVGAHRKIPVAELRRYLRRQLALGSAGSTAGGGS